MKRIVVLICVILLLINTVPAITAGTVAVLSADEVHVNNDTVLVPVKISDNPGIMGFKVIIKYSTDKLEVTGVTAGNVTSKGSFMHNAEKASGQVDVVWFSTEQTAENGNLFVLSVKPASRLKEGESTQIGISYSQADTFNEKYEDVAFDCKPITVLCGEQTPQSGSQNPDQESTPKPTQKPAEEATQNEITDEQLINAVEVALNNSGDGEINDDTVNDVNENLRTIVGPSAPQFNSADDLQRSYHTAVANEYSKQAKINIDPETYSEIYHEVLDSRGVQSFSELDAAEKSSAVSEMYEKMHDVDPSLPDISNTLSDDESASLFDQLIAKTEDENIEQKKDDSKQDGFPIYIVIVIVLIILSGVACIIILRKKKKVNQESK